ncbi:MAG TPA: choice-of-anchor tandem repeat GloVer-containing protein [Rhizomicrobium sp.]|jgi:uncharacterized repeat protein (TIGR03803 family)|nr:choice-of-anchor tandem repeat GloVer-containing protein [Rhizomicrobium sp.]
MKKIWTAMIACGMGCALHSSVAEAASEQVLWTFGNGSDGANPYGGVIDVGGALGTVYGMTSSGGIYHYGTLFSLNLASDTETILRSFRDGRDGYEPYASVIRVDRTLYGALGGGAHGEGTLSSFDEKTGAETILHAFNGKDGHGPRYLINVNGTLYGTTIWGGTYNDGTLFSYNLQTGTATVLYSFGNGADGINPYCTLINVNGTLFGTTLAGGANGLGAVFSFDPQTNTETVPWSFGNGTDGQTPHAGLVNVNGTLYGTTYYGGANGAGTVFSFNPSSNAEAVAWSFGNGTDGQNPSASLTNVNGTLFGTTYAGGAYGYGTVFSFMPNSEAETVLWSFGNGTDGRYPTSRLISVNGTLYGTTTAGGMYLGGTLFEVIP